MGISRCSTTDALLVLLRRLLLALQGEAEAEPRNSGTYPRNSTFGILLITGTPHL